MPAPTYIASSSATNVVTASADITVTYPASSRPGDYLLLEARFIRLVDGAYTVATPSGWTLVQSQNASGVSDSNAALLYGRFRGAETSVTVTASTSDQMFATGTIQAYRGVNATPVNASASAYSNASSTSNNTPTVTTTVPNCALALFASGYRSGSQTAYTYAWTAPATERQDVTAAQSGANARIGLTDATNSQVAAGATGAKTCASSVATLGRFAAAVALAPASEGNFFAVL